MCVICVKNKGIQMPSITSIENMFNNNPDGAGYMILRNGNVEIHKGYMTFDSFLEDLIYENITIDDVIIMHFRISTQANNPTMTHPFPMTKNIDNCLALDISCKLGIAHNGIISMTSNPSEKVYNDTSLFITKYMSKIIRNVNDLKDQNVLDLISQLTNSKWAFLDSSGFVQTIGKFINENGLLYSNSSYQSYEQRYESIFENHIS